MNKEHILKENNDFGRIVKNYKPFKYKEFIVYLEQTNEKKYKFGLSVGKKIGNAVRRNRVKRQLKSIISKKDYKSNFNCIIIVNRNVNLVDYNIMSKDLYYIFDKLNIEEKKDEK